MRARFAVFANALTNAASTPWALPASIISVLAWIAVGGFIGFGDKWQLPVNTVTTIITYILGFAILFSGAVATKAILLKLDVIVEATAKADNRFVGIESLTDAELDKLKKQIERRIKKGKK